MPTFILDLDRPSTVQRAREASQMVDWGPGWPSSIKIDGRRRSVRDIELRDLAGLGRVHAERLMQVMRVLLTLGHDRRFNLGSYINHGVCGTVACACGWSMLDPWFQEHMPRYPDPDLARAHTTIADCRGVDHVASYADLSMWITGSRHLSNHLFLPYSYPGVCAHTPHAVVERIRLVLNLAGYTGQHTLEF